LLFFVLSPVIFYPSVALVTMPVYNIQDVV